MTALVGRIIRKALLVIFLLPIAISVVLSFFESRFVTIARISSEADGNLAVSTTSGYALYIKDHAVAARLNYPAGTDMEFMVRDDIWYFFSDQGIVSFPLENEPETNIEPVNNVSFDSGKIVEYSIVTDEFTSSIVYKTTNETVCRFYRETLYDSMRAYAFATYLCAGLALVTISFCRENRDADTGKEQQSG